MRTVSMIGVGRLGGALALALAAKGYVIENLVSRDLQKASAISDLLGSRPNVLPAGDYAGITSQIIFITTQDSGIGAAAHGLTGLLWGKPYVFHTSGSLSSEILDPLKTAGCQTGSIHPLISISDPELGAQRLSGGYFCIEGTPAALEIARSIVADLGGKGFTLETRFKALYHAAALIAAGHLTALLDVAFETMSKCGLTPDDAREVLMPLVRSTVENLAVQPSEKALTGTFARADAETFERHLAALTDSSSADTVEIYLQLALRSLHLAERNGVDIKQVERLREKVLMAKSSLR
jgi:predicted short-subunit dehydrogenase-like oxidoreductase (DUF2520 family)